jgi:hypothetical protein
VNYDSGILLGIPSDIRSSVKAIIDFTISQMSDKQPPSGDSEEFIRNRCRYGLCRIRLYCISVGRVCVSVRQDFLVPNDSLNRPLIIVFDNNPALIKRQRISVWLFAFNVKDMVFFKVTGWY